MQYFSKVLLIISCGVLSTSAVAGNPSRSGDIVGRDLSVWGLGAIGHIGIWNGSRVAEVLNEPKVIQFNTLTNFKSRSSYWGARGNSRFYNTYNITRLAYNQSNYNPSYTLVPSATRIGGLKRQCVKRSWYGGCTRYGYVRVNARFRCDTFVDYIYKATGNGKLSSWSSILPRIAYYKVSQTR